MAVYFLFTWPEHRDAFRVGILSVLGEGADDIRDVFAEHGWTTDNSRGWMSGRETREAQEIGMTVLGGILEDDNDRYGSYLASMSYRVPHYGMCVTGTDDGHVTFASDGRRFFGYTGYSHNLITPLGFLRQQEVRGPLWRPWTTEEYMDETRSVIDLVKSRKAPGRSTIMDSISLQSPLQLELIGRHHPLFNPGFPRQPESFQRIIQLTNRPPVQRGTP